MKKKINTQAILNELQGSVFFPAQQQKPSGEQPQIKPPSLPEIKASTSGRPSEESNQASLQASTIASKHTSTLAISQEIIETIRKIVKTPAKEEVLYVRITKEEKHQLGDIEYTYKRQNIDTSVNALGRIAVNFLIADYHANGEKSILAKVLTALNA